MAALKLCHTYPAGSTGAVGVGDGDGDGLGDGLADGDGLVPGLEPDEVPGAGEPDCLIPDLPGAGAFPFGAALPPEVPALVVLLPCAPAPPRVPPPGCSVEAAPVTVPVGSLVFCSA